MINHLLLKQLWTNVRIKRVFSVVCFLMLLNISYVHAQNERIDINVNNVTLKEFITTVESKSPYSFTYRDAMLEGKSKVTLNLKNATVKQVLDQVLTPAKLSYTIEGTSILISEQSSAKHEIVGRITDAAGESLIGATVTQRGTKNATITDFDGNYKLTAPLDAELEVSYIGYETQVIKAGGKTL